MALDFSKYMGKRPANCDSCEFYDYDEYTESYGCILSEFPPGTPPLARNFPKRNRIISGLSCGVLVVEAPEKSGALITARQALDQGRDVFVVPGNIDVPSFEGSNQLLRDGAIPVFSGWDVVSEYEALYPEILDYAYRELKDDSGLGIAVLDGNETETEAVKAAGFLLPVEFRIWYS